jgi:hypothetical protein
METPFLGGTYQSFSSNLADDRCMNLYPEVVETKQGKQVGGFYSTPGQKLLQVLTNSGSGAVSGPMRGIHKTANNKLVAVFGNQVVQIDINGVVTPLGHLNTASGPVSIIDNGRQYAVFDGFQGWSWSGSTWAQITTIPNFPLIACEQDGFGIVGIAGTNQFYQSNLNDLTTWDPLNFSSADSNATNIQAIFTLFRQLWVLKENAIEIWNNAGLNGFAFQRMEGAYVNVGCVAPFSVATSEDHIFWLGQSDEGSLQAYVNNGYSEQRISTHAIEYQIQSYLAMSSIGIADAIGFCYTQAGHVFYVLTFPSGNATWVYDMTIGLWHERGEFINGSYNRWDPSCYAFFNKQHVVGSSTNQRLSVLDLTYPTNDLATTPPSNPKRWMRRWRALKKPMQEPVRLQSLKVDMQTGVVVGTATKITNQADPFALGTCNVVITLGSNVYRYAMGYNSSQSFTGTYGSNTFPLQITVDNAGFISLNYTGSATTNAFGAFVEVEPQYGFNGAQLKQFITKSSAVTFGAYMSSDSVQGGGVYYNAPYSPVPIHRYGITGYNTGGVTLNPGTWLGFSSLATQALLVVASPTSSPVILKWSDDGGHSWSNEMQSSSGATGETAYRVMWRRIGSTRRNRGLDRIFEISSEMMIQTCLVGASIGDG